MSEQAARSKAGPVVGIAVALAAAAAIAAGAWGDTAIDSPANPGGCDQGISQDQGS